MIHLAKPEDVPAEPTENQIYAWRKATREWLLAKRLDISPAVRREHATQIARHVLPLLAPLDDRVVSLYWPIRAEPDLRSLMPAILDAGGHCALPVVVEKKAPMVFRLWEPEMKLVPGIWNIPGPPGDKVVIPDVVIAPLVGHDGACYRLGYGGGYFDRTLANFLPRPLAVGVGYTDAALPTIHPLAHDIPLDAIVTEHGVLNSACLANLKASHAPQDPCVQGNGLWFHHLVH